MISFFKIIVKFIIFFNLIFCKTYINKIKQNIHPLQPIEQRDFQNLNAKNLVQIKKDTKARKEVLTYYSADELIRKKVPWKNKEDFEIHLKGNATIIHEKTKIYAPLMIIDPDNNAKILGKIIVIEEEQGIFFYAENGEYSRNEEKIKISNQPYMRIKAGDEVILIATDEIIRNIPQGEVIFKNYLKMFGNDWTLLGNESIYYDKTKSFVVAKYPVLLGKDLYLSGEKIVYQSNLQKIVIENDPILFLNLRNNHNVNKKENQKDNTINPKNLQTDKELMVVQAHTIEYILKKEERKGIAKGNVRMLSNTKKIFGEEFILYGKDFDRLESKQKVIIEDLKENFYLESHYMFYDLKERKLILKNQPKITIFHDSTKQSIKEELHASIIERDFNKEITIAKGGVWFKRDNEIVEAEYAYIDEKNEIMQVTGNPKLKRQDVEIYAKRIDIYKDRMELQKEIEIKIY